MRKHSLDTFRWLSQMFGHSSQKIFSQNFYKIAKVAPSLINYSKQMNLINSPLCSNIHHGPYGVPQTNVHASLLILSSKMSKISHIQGRQVDFLRCTDSGASSCPIVAIYDLGIISINKIKHK